MHQPNDVLLATTPRDRCDLHYAERGSREGEAYIFLHGYSDSWYSREKE
jgi:pimeloyl-ACP methyl ester carboxylesterase